MKRPKPTRDRFGRFAKCDAQGAPIEIAVPARDPKTGRYVPTRLKKRKHGKKTLDPNEIWEAIADDIETELGERPTGKPSELVIEKWGEAWHRFDFQWAKEVDLEYIEYIVNFARHHLRPHYRGKTAILLDMVGNRIGADGEVGPHEKLGWLYPISSTLDFDATWNHFHEDLLSAGSPGWSENYIPDGATGFSVHVEVPKWAGKRITKERGVKYARAMGKARRGAKRTGRSSEHTSKNAGTKRTTKNSRGGKKRDRK